METTVSHRPPGDTLPPAPPGPPRSLRLAARLTVVALILWTVIDVLRTTLAVGRYESRIVTVTHGVEDVLPAALVYALFTDLMPRSTVTTVADTSWFLGLLVVAAAFITWLYHARRNAVRLGGTLAWAPAWTVGGWFVPVANLVIPYLVVWDVRRASGPAARPAPVGWWWASALVTVLVNRLIWLYDVVTSNGGAFEGTALDRRTVAYPLWLVGMVMIEVMAFLSAYVVWRITASQQRTAGVDVDGESSVDVGSDPGSTLPQPC